jgi:hypothetical protein
MTLPEPNRRSVDENVWLRLIGPSPRCPMASTYYFVQLYWGMAFISTAVGNGGGEAVEPETHCL